MSVTSPPPVPVSNVRATWPANSGWLTSRPVSITAMPGGSAPGRGERLRGAHGVVGPGELEALVVGVGHVERVLGRSQLAVTLDVGHAPVAAQGGHQRRAAGGAGCEHADRCERLRLGPEAAEGGGPLPRGRRGRARPRARAQARGRGRSAPARASRLRPTPPNASESGRATAPCPDARASWRSSSRSATRSIGSVEACAGAAASGPARSIASAALRTSAMVRGAGRRSLACCPGAARDPHRTTRPADVRHLLRVRFPRLRARDRPPAAGARKPGDWAYEMTFAALVGGSSGRGSTT